jgi:uncharacterized membrane protein YhiD involved in acid resistance
MQTVLNLETLFSLILSVVFGLVVGIEKRAQSSSKLVSLTHILVKISLGACVLDDNVRGSEELPTD